MNRPTLADAIAMIAEWLASHTDFRFCCRRSIGIIWGPNDQDPTEWHAKLEHSQHFYKETHATGATFEEATIKLAQVIVEKP